MNYFYHLECILCHKKTNEKETTSVCPSCSGPLDVVYDFDYLKNQVNSYVLRTAPPKVAKYLDLLPLTVREHLVTLEEGGTPLHLARNLGKTFGLTNLFIKVEGQNPTGAFKDRGSFVEINKTKELGYKAVVVASTGNMAASVAAYSVQAGLPCYVFVPDTTPRGKLAQSLSYGAHVIQIRGTYADAFKITAETAEKYGFYLAGDYAFRLEGQKTLAYEVVEQSFFKSIDWVIVPVGMGTHLAGIWKGFVEYYKLGFIKRLPKMIAVQAEGAAPVVQAFHKKGKIVPVAKPQTVSSAIAVGDPLDGEKVLNALKESQGLAIAVSDDDTLAAQQLLARQEGIYVEPAAATVIAAVQKLVQDQTLKENDRIICVTTGAGLKDAAATLRVLAEPPVIEPTISEVDRVIKGNLFAIRAGGMVDQGKELFKGIPEEKKLLKILKDEFTVDAGKIDLPAIYRELHEFKEKGKAVTKADLQAIIETIIQQDTGKKYLEVVDFTITDTKHKQAYAEVVMKLDGKTMHAQAHGVGPVDAAINALRTKLNGGKGKNIQLMDYNVEVAAVGTDAAVVVTLVMKDEKGSEVVVRQTSPDIIVASLEAFERGYNELINRSLSS